MVFKYTNYFLFSLFFFSPLGAMRGKKRLVPNQRPSVLVRRVVPDEALLNAISDNNLEAVQKALRVKVKNPARVTMHMAGTPTLSFDVIDTLLGGASGNIYYPKYDPREPDVRSQCALVQAAFSGNMTLAAYLIAQGANVDCADSIRWTPLHGAVSGRQPELIKLLLAHGARTHYRDRQKRTPLEFARQLGNNKECVALLGNPTSFDYALYRKMVTDISDTLLDRVCDQALEEFEKIEKRTPKISLPAFDVMSLENLTKALDRAYEDAENEADRYGLEHFGICARIKKEFKKYEGALMGTSIGIGFIIYTAWRVKQIMSENESKLAY